MNGDVELARGFVVPGLVAHHDFQQLVHRCFHLACGHQQAGFGQSGVKVALVLGDAGVELFQGPATALVGADELQGLQPLAQGLKAQWARHLRQHGGEGGLGFIELADADQQLDQVVTRLFVVRC
jgi:hypothetical protein